MRYFNQEGDGLLLMDWAKGCSIHRLYGHDEFLREAKHADKSKGYAIHICHAVECSRKNELIKKAAS